MANNPGSSNNMDKLPLSDVVDVNVERTAQPVYDKSQSLVDIANNTFKELCRTLENEQTKLLELEERRKKLQEEMQRLKMEIEEEKDTYRIHLVETMPEGMDMLQANSATSFGNDEFTEVDTDSETTEDYTLRQQLDLQKKLDTCYEVDENNDDELAAAGHERATEGAKRNDAAGMSSTSLESQLSSETREQRQSDEQFTDSDEEIYQES